MAFDGRHDAFAYSLFPTQRPASVNEGVGNNGSVASPIVSFPSVSMQEQHVGFNVPRKPAEMIDCDEETGLQQLMSNILVEGDSEDSFYSEGKPAEMIDCDEETGLQQLMSNILVEGDSEDSFYSEGSLPKCNPFWSPLTEEVLEYFQSGAKTWQNPTFPQNYVSHKAFGQAQGQSQDDGIEEFCHPYFNHLGSMQYKRVNAGNTQQLQPPMLSVNDPRRPSNVTINSSNFSSRSILPYGTVLPGMDVADMMSANESAASNFYAREMMTRRRERPYYGMASALTTSVVMNQGGPAIQRNLYLDGCFYQWKCLKNEREKIQAILSQTFHWEEIADMNNISVPKTPQNPTRVDYVIVKHAKEQARVAALLDRLYNSPLHINIHTALSRHNIAICQVRIKAHIANMSKHHPKQSQDSATLLVIALKDLAATTRKLRTTLWCAYQMALPKPVRRQEQHAASEATHTERSPSPFDGYSFRISLSRYQA